MTTNNKEKMIIGIDVSKDTLDIYYNEQSFKIENAKQSIQKFISSLPVGDGQEKLCVMESTGGYERLAFKTFSEEGIPTHVAHPNQVHAFAKAAKHFAKTDKLDAMLLQKYGKFISDEEEGDVVLDGRHQEIIYLKKLARSIEKSLHAAHCRIKQMSELCRKYLQKEVDFYTKQLKAIQEEIDKKIDSHPELKMKRDLMMTMKGVGKKTASALLAELPELGQISSKEITSLVGVAPRTYQSGKRDCRRKIYGGRFYARKTLYMIALVAARTDEVVRNKYKMLVAKEKPKKVALVAIMRETIVALNAMVRTMKPFNYKNYGCAA